MNIFEKLQSENTRLKNILDKIKESRKPDTLGDYYESEKIVKENEELKKENKELKQEVVSYKDALIALVDRVELFEKKRKENPNWQEPLPHVQV